MLTFWATNFLSCAAESTSPTQDASENCEHSLSHTPAEASTIQHCTNQSKDTVTQRETVNQHPAKKRTLYSYSKTQTLNASLTSAKRSVVSSDATETHPSCSRTNGTKRNKTSRTTRTDGQEHDKVARHGTCHIITSHSGILIMLTLAPSLRSRTSSVHTTSLVSFLYHAPTTHWRSSCFVTCSSRTIIFNSTRARTQTWMSTRKFPERDILAPCYHVHKPTHTTPRVPNQRILQIWVRQIVGVVGVPYVRFRSKNAHSPSSRKIAEFVSGTLAS